MQMHKFAFDPMSGHHIFRYGAIVAIISVPH